jgi:hypothetical protein
MVGSPLGAILSRGRRRKKVLAKEKAEENWSAGP